MPDVFISHATEDKEKVARPLAEALRENGLDVWYDEYSLKIGDDLRELIDDGIRKSKFGIVILSKSFFAKQWTKKELDALFAREITGEKVILPIWHELSYEEILALAPTLATRYAAKTSEGMEQMVNKILKVVKPEKLEEMPEISTQPLVDIRANKDSILLSTSIIFSGHCINGGENVHLFIIGPGTLAKGKKIASPIVSSSGQWEFNWTPEVSIEPGQYVMQVCDSMSRVSDEVAFRIERGAITMLAHGSQTYYIGEKVRLSGTSTFPAKEIFLSIMEEGFFTKQRKIDQLNVICQNNKPATFTRVEIEDDHTWSFMWDTSLVASELKKGHYTIYATESPLTLENLTKKAYSLCSIIIEQPFVSGTISQSTIAQGDQLIIAGVAQGKPRNGVQIWIFGDELCLQKRIRVNRDSTYSLRVSREETKQLNPGQYFVVVQHPMMNNKFDVYLDAHNHKILSSYPKSGTLLFTIDGPEKKMGATAAKALLEALNNPNIDDTYSKTVFFVERPEIQLDPISDILFGNKITITATTNLSVDDEILVQIFESEFLKRQRSGNFSGTTGVVKVTKGDAGINKFAYPLDTSLLKRGEYIVNADGVMVNVKGESRFNILG